MITNKFVEKIINAHDVALDTKQHRYVAQQSFDGTECSFRIMRIPLSYLDTTAAYDSWELVASGVLYATPRGWRVKERFSLRACL